jgi:8-oxo-dGTP pyrophosphatase MutT (NUDIX family)
VNEKVKPRQAATVILLRRAEAKGFEVFLTRRPGGMPFLGGMYCYPGGSVTKADSSAAMTQRCAGLSPESARKVIGAEFSPREAIGFWAAAIRELFEEVGVLLAVGSSDARFKIDQLEVDGLEDLHRALLGKSLSFAALLKKQELYCDLARLAYFSHWQTPAQNAMRFDTRFFVAALPDDQAPLESSYEVARSVWLAPDQAMALHERGDLPMIFPTFASLRTLADFDTLESVLKEYRGAAASPRLEAAKASQRR